jgi:hypothetical protein
VDLLLLGDFLAMVSSQDVMSLIGELLRRQQLDLSLAFCLGGVVDQSCCANTREVGTF